MCALSGILVTLRYSDVNECEDDQAMCRGGTCINQPGSYRCQCPDGLELSPDGTKCIGE